MFSLPSAAHETIDVLLAQRQAGTNYFAPYQIAEFYADTGDKDRAFQWFNTAYQERCFWLIFLPVDATLDSLRSDPR